MLSDYGPSEDPYLATAVRLTALERRSRWLLHAYPAAYRHERAEEMISTLLETTPDGRTWPRLRDVRALATGGLRARAAQNRQRTTAANLRFSVMVGVALFLAFWVARYLSSVAGASAWHAWPTALTGLLIATAILLAWTTPRFVALTGALAAPAEVMLAGVLASVLWIAVDARPTIAFITLFVLSLVQSGTANIRIAGYIAAQLLPLFLITAAIAALAAWLLRRQSARAPG